MTYKEWMREHHPDMIGEDYIGGVCGCPYHNPELEWPHTGCPTWLNGMRDDVKCLLCWSQTMPEIPAETGAESVEHPAHYTQGKVECIEAIESAVGGLEPMSAYCVGNIIKYVWRYHNKNGLEDLRKANWYLNRLMDLEVDKNAEATESNAD